MIIKVSSMKSFERILLIFKNVKPKSKILPTSLNSLKASYCTQNKTQNLTLAKPRMQSPSCDLASGYFLPCLLPHSSSPTNIPHT